jgi:hypothetical protein
MEDTVNIPAVTGGAMSVIPAAQGTAGTAIPHQVTDMAADDTDTGIIRTAMAAPAN